MCKTKHLHALDPHLRRRSILPHRPGDRANLPTLVNGRHIRARQPAALGAVLLHRQHGRRRHGADVERNGRSLRGSGATAVRRRGGSGDAAGGGAVGVGAGVGPSRGGVDQLLDGSDLLAVVVLLELRELRLDVLDEGVALGASKLAEEFFCTRGLVAVRYLVVRRDGVEPGRTYE